MHDVLIRFKLIKNDYVFEAVLDSRLSFKDNFKLLQNIIDKNLKNIRVFDPNKRVFLDENTPLVNFNINNFILLYLF